MNFNLKIYIGLLIIFACDQNNSNEIVIEKAKPVEIFTFQLDSVSSYNPRYIDFITWENEPSLATINQPDNSIRIYNLSTGLEVHKIGLVNANTPKGIYQIRGFDILNSDSIFVAGLHGNSLKLIDNNGNIIQDYSISSQEGERLEARGRRVISTLSKIYYLGNSQLFMNGHPDYNIRNPEEYFKNNVGIIIDLTSESFKYLPLTWPKSFGGLLWNFNYTFDLDSESKKLYFNFGSSDSVFVYHLNESDKNTTQFLAKSKLKNSPQPLSKGMNMQEYNMKNPFYSGVLYNQSTDHIYRFLYHGHEDEEMLDGLDYYNAPFSILVFNENKELIKEVVLPAKNYNPQVVIPFRTGVLISIHNKYNKSFSEDELILHYLDLEN